MKKILVFILFILAIMPMAMADMTGSESMTRTTPTSIGPGQTFSITYTAVGTSGTWGASIEEVVTGGCTFPSGGTTYRTVMLSEDGNTKTVNVKAPQSGQCTFSGDYKFGTFSIKDFTDRTIAVVAQCVPQTEVCDGIDNDCDNQIDEGGVCTCSEDWECGGWSDCINNLQARTCVDSNHCGTEISKPVESRSCTSGGGSSDDGSGFCQYMEWASFISEDNYCIAGVGIILGVLVLLRIVLK